MKPKLIILGVFVSLLTLFQMPLKRSIAVLPFNGKVRICFSKASGKKTYLYYTKWIKSYNKEIECIDLWPLTVEKAILELAKSDGLIITGGPDVQPKLYGKPEELKRCTVEPERDTLDIALIKKATELKIPILGICRGLQVLNIAFGGSLIVDIPDDIGTKVKHKCASEEKCDHRISIIKGSLLNDIIGDTSGNVNSYHHQGIGKLADSFKMVAFAEGGIPEAIEWKNPEGKAFLLAVQWHPERMNFSDKFSRALAISFINETQKYHLK
jgi:putative glutamine amidotransferase